ncbi:MAG: transposase [Lentisphaerae bacterium]|nr:transposase [Lentisphaerota bacterium]
MKKPLSFTGDNIYGRRDDRELLGGLEIRAAFRPLGRRSPVKSLSKKNWLRRKNRKRNRIKGSFGHGKEHAGLKLIRYRSESGVELWSSRFSG